MLDVIHVQHLNKKWRNINEIGNVGLADCNLIISDWKSSDYRSYVIAFTSQENTYKFRKKIAFSTSNILYFLYLLNPKPFKECGKFLRF